MKEIYIYGASGHGLVVSDIASLCGYDKIYFIDDGANDFPTFNDIKKNNHIPIVFGIGSNKIREKLFFKVKTEGFKIETLVHPSSVISSSVKIEEGTVIMPNVVINSNSKIGKGVILNTSCILEHENIIENFVHISPRVALAGNVTVEKSTHIGIGTCCIQGKVIGKSCTIGAGSVIVKDIPNNVKAFGNPCKIIEVINE